MLITLEQHLPLKCPYLLKVLTQPLPRGYYSFLPEGRQRSSDMSPVNLPSYDPLSNRCSKNVLNLRRKNIMVLYWLYLKEQSLWGKKSSKFHSNLRLYSTILKQPEGSTCFLKATNSNQWYKLLLLRDPLHNHQGTLNININSNDKESHCK